MHLKGKKLISYIVTIMILLSVVNFPVMGHAATTTSGKCGDNVTWELKDGTLVITGTGEMEDILLSTWTPWYSYRGEIVDIKIQDGVTRIGDNAFASCYELENIEIPDSVTSIGKAAFDECVGLKNIEIPNSVITMGDYVFFRCYNLMNMKVPNGVTSIGKYAFAECYDLEQIIIPGTVESVGESLFKSLSSLNKVFYFGSEEEWETIEGISNSNIDISKVYFNATECDIVGHKADVFDKIDKITCQKIGNCTLCGEYVYDEIESVTGGTCGTDVKWDFIDGSLYISGTGDMTTYATKDEVPWKNFEIESVYVGRGVTSVTPYAFYNSETLKEVILADSVMSVGEKAFYFCIGLEKIAILNQEISISSNAFAHVTPEQIYFAGEEETWKAISNDLATALFGQKKNNYSVKECTVYDNHTEDEVVVENYEPACEKDGSYDNVIYCTVCEKELSREHVVVEQKGHDFVNYITDNNIICTEDGTETAICENGCGKKDVRVVVAKGHSFTKFEEQTDGQLLAVCDNGCGEERYKVENTDILYYFMGDTLTISGKGEIPDYGIDPLGGPWAVNKESVKTIVIEDGITRIGQYAFAGMVGVEKLVMSSNVTEIGKRAFWQDSGLNHIAYNGNKSDWETIEIETGNESVVIDKVTYEGLVEDLNITLVDDVVVYTGAFIKPEVTVTDKESKTLVKDKDYTVTYSDNKNAGTATVVITGKGFYKGTAQKEFTINKAEQEVIASLAATSVAAGEKKTVTVTEGIGNVTFRSGNTKVAMVDDEGIITGKTVGTATITVTAAGDNNYKAASKSFEIRVYCCHEAEPVVSKPYIAPECEKNGAEEEKTCPVCGMVVQESKVIDPTGHEWEEKYTIDKEVTCTENGSKSIHCKKCNSSQANSTVVIVAEGHKYNSTLIEAAEVGQNGSCKDVCAVCFDTVNKTILAPKEMTLSKTSYGYNGKVQKPSVTIKDSAGKVIAANNYTATYPSGCKNLGTYTVKVTFKNNYSGEISKSYKIVKGTQTISASNKTFTTKGSAASLGAKRTAGNGTLTYKSSNTKVATINSAGKITPKAVGKATITITAKATRTYNAATKKITVTVNPKGKTLSSVATNKNGQLTAKWKKASDITGYQLRYSTSSKMKNAKTISAGIAKTTSKTITGLSKGKKYYVQLRTYKKSGSKTYYSGWSSTKSVTTMNVSLSASKVSLKKGDTKTLVVKNKGSKKIKWTTSKKKVATVSSSGKVTAKAVGTTTITATVGSQKLTCKVTVKERQWVEVRMHIPQQNTMNYYVQFEIANYSDEDILVHPSAIAGSKVVTRYGGSFLVPAGKAYKLSYYRAVVSSDRWNDKWKDMYLDRTSEGRVYVSNADESSGRYPIDFKGNGEFTKLYIPW